MSFRLTTYFGLFVLLLSGAHAAVVANWTLTSTADTSGNSYTLNNNGVTFNAVGAQFSGAQYLNRSFIPAVNKFTNWTVVGEFKMDSLNGSGSIFCYANGTNDRFCIDTAVSTGLRGGLYNGATYASRGSFPRSYFNDTDWHCFAYVYNTSTTNPTFILDSAPSTEVNTPATGGGAVPQIVMGTRDDKVSNNFTGQISSILIYDTLLTNDQVLKACSDIRVQPAGVTITTTPLSGNAPKFGSNIKSFQFIGEDYYIDTNGDAVLDTLGNTTWHRQYALAAGMTSWRADMRLDKSAGVNTFNGTNGSLYNVRTARTAIEWMYANNMTLTLIADYMPFWLANVTSSCATNTQYCNPTNYTTWGQLVVNYIKNVTNNNATLQSIITVEVWNEPYLFFHSNGTVADRVNGYVPLYNHTYAAIKGNFTNMPVMLSTIYTQSLGNSFSIGVLGNLTAAGYRTDCTATHEYADTTLYDQIENESNFVSGYSNYSTCMALTEYNSFESNPQVNFSTSSRKWISDALINSVNYQRNFQQYQQYDWSDKAKYTSNTTVFENFPHEYRIVSEPLLDNSIYYPYIALKQLNTYHSYGKTNVNTTSNTSTVLSIASITGSNTMAVTLLNKNTGKNVILTFTNTSYTTLTDTSTGAVYSITGGVANVTIGADNISTFEATAPDTQAPNVTWNSPTNTTYNTREININLTATDSYGNISAYWFSNGSVRLNLTPFSDWSNNNNNLNMSGFGTYNVSSNSMSFNGASGNVMVTANSLPWFDTRNMTFSLWLYPNEFNQSARNRPLAGGKFTNGTVYNQWYLNREAASSNWNVAIGAANQSSVSCGNTITSSQLVANNWNHVLVTRNDSMLFTYVNGVLVGNDTTCSSNYNGDVAPMWIGGGSIVGERFNGSITDVRVFNKMLSSSEASQVYNNKTITSGLQVWYQFANNGTGRYIAQDGSNTWTGYANDTSNNVGSTGISFSVDRSISFSSTTPSSPVDVEDGNSQVFSYVLSNPASWVVTSTWYIDGISIVSCYNSSTCTIDTSLGDSGSFVINASVIGGINNISSSWVMNIVDNESNCGEQGFSGVINYIPVVAVLFILVSIILAITGVADLTMVLSLGGLGLVLSILPVIYGCI